jgi:ATP-dependent Lhr-like helicase
MAYDRSLFEGVHIVFSGRRWRVVSVDFEERIVHVEPSPGGRMPHFRGDYSGLVDDAIRRRMRAVLESAEIGAYLDREARGLLLEARANYLRLGLDQRSIIASGKDTLVFVWRGDRAMSTIGLLLAARQLDVSVEGPAITLLGARPAAVREHLEALSREGPADPLALAATVSNKAQARYDWVLDDDLLCADYASRALDARGAHEAIREVVAAQA